MHLVSNAIVLCNMPFLSILKFARVPTFLTLSLIFRLYAARKVNFKTVCKFSKLSRKLKLISRFKQYRLQHHKRQSIQTLLRRASFSLETINLNIFFFFWTYHIKIKKQQYASYCSNSHHRN